METEMNARMRGQGVMEKEILNKRVAVADAYIAIWTLRLPYIFCKE